MTLDILLTLVTERGEEQRGEEGESMRAMAHLRGFTLYKNPYEVYQR